MKKFDEKYLYLPTFSFVYTVNIREIKTGFFAGIYNNLIKQSINIVMSLKKIGLLMFMSSC